MDQRQLALAPETDPPLCAGPTDICDSVSKRI